MFFWATIIRRSVKLRQFEKKQWTEYVDNRLNAFFYVNEKETLRTWIKPSVISKKDEDDAWEKILEDVEEVFGFEQRGQAVGK